MSKRPDPITRSVRMDSGTLCLGDGTERGEAVQRRLLAGALRHLPDGPYELIVQPYEETRRGRANRYYRGVVLKLIAAESGYTPDDLHEIFKVRHNSKVLADPDGVETRIGQTTTKLTISGFSDYLEKVMLDGAEWWGISFPEPREAEDWREKRRGLAA